MIGTILTDKAGKVLAPVSSYQPKEGVDVLTSKIKRDYEVGHKNQTQKFREFNDLSVLEVAERDQKLFNSYVAPKSEDPDEAWQWNGVKPVTRNKIISIAAHATAALIYPNTFAQNKNDEEDKGAALVMRDLIEYNIENSDYEETFLFGVIAACVNPCVYLQSEFAEVQQRIKEQDEKGTISTKEVIDDVLSGLKTNLIPVDEMLIANVYQYEHQRQRFTIHRRFIEYDEAERIYGDHDNFKFIQPGIKAIYSENDGQFYDQKDDELTTLVEEVIYRNRLEDVEIAFVNGVYLGDKDVDANPMKHRDCYNRPKYSEAKGGYEPVDEKRFYYYKSAVSKLAPDQELTDSVWRMAMNASFLSAIPPIAISGNETVNSSVIFPGSVNVFKKDTKVEQINTGVSSRPAFEALAALDNSMTESSQDRLRSGMTAGSGSRTAREVLLAEKNADIASGLFKKMIKSLVEDFGYLLIDNIIHHQTVAQVEEITGGKTRETYKSFLIPEKVSGGKKITKKIVFEPNLIGNEPKSPNEYMDKSMDLLSKEGGMDGDQRIYLVNPEKFRNILFKIRVDADEMTPRGKEFEKAMNLEAYDRMIGNPFVEGEAITRDFLVESFRPGESDKYMRKPDKGGQKGGAPKTSINFKDVPPEAQVQMLAQAGINVQPVQRETSPLVSDLTGSRNPALAGR